MDGWMKIPQDFRGLAQKSGVPRCGQGQKEVQITQNRDYGVGPRDPGAPSVGGPVGREGRPYPEQDTHTHTCVHAHTAGGSPSPSGREEQGVLACALRGTLLSKADIVSRSAPRSVLSARHHVPAGRRRKARHACCLGPARPVSSPLCQWPRNRCPNMCAKGTCVEPPTPLPTLHSTHKCPLSRVCPQWWEHLVCNSHLPVN